MRWGRLSRNPREISTRPLRLLFLMTGACGTSGGIANANLNVLKALLDVSRDHGAELTVFSFLERREERPDFLPAKVGFVPFHGRRLAFVVKVLAAAAHTDVLLVDHVALALPVLPLAATGAARTIIFAHGSEAWKGLQRIDQWSFRSAKLCVANSEFTARKMRERMPGARVTACPLGLSPRFRLNRMVPPAPEGRFTLESADGAARALSARFLLLVGRIDPRERQKGHRELLARLPNWLQDFPDLQIVFVGPGEDRQDLREIARALGVSHAVFVPGWLSTAELEQLYARCAAFVMPSRQEGFGLVYLEAMNFGKPCVGCWDQGAEDVILDGKTGFLLRDGSDPNELDGVVRRLLQFPDLRKRLGQNGFRRLHERFTAQHYQNRLVSLIRPLL